MSCITVHEYTTLINVFSSWRRALLSSNRIEEMDAAVRSTATDGVQLVLCVFPGAQQDDVRYAAFKKTCNTLLGGRGVPSQVVHASTLSRLQARNDYSIAVNLAIQMLCKLGAPGWTVEIKVLSYMYS